MTIYHDSVECVHCGHAFYDHEDGAQYCPVCGGALIRRSGRKKTQRVMHTASAVMIGGGLPLIVLTAASGGGAGYIFGTAAVLLGLWARWIVNRDRKAERRERRYAKYSRL